MNITGDAKLICSALVKARGEMNATVIKDAKGNFGRYATLAALVEVSTPHLTKHGLTVVQVPWLTDAGVTVGTWLIHESGATMEFEPLTMPLANRTPHAVGSAITYAKRYARSAILDLPSDDDDAQAAQNATEARNAPVGVNGTVKPKNTQDAPPVQPDNTWELDEGPERVSDAQLKHLHALGKKYYGMEWDEMRPKLVIAVTTGATDSSKELTPKEADKIITGIEKRLAARQAQPAEA